MIDYGLDFDVKVPEPIGRGCNIFASSTGLPISGLRESSMPISKTSVRWVLVGWMFLVSAIAYLDRVNISIAGPSIAEEFHLSNLELGSVFSAFVLGYAFFQAPGGWLADRPGARRVLMLGVSWGGLFTAAVTLIRPNEAG